MHELGISIYPNEENTEEIIKYIDKSSKLGYTRIFTNLLSVKKEEKIFFLNFKKVIAFAKSKNMKVTVDINKKVFQDLNLTYQDLSYFKELGISGIRLDEGFTAQEASDMTFNPENIFIELSMSGGNAFIEDVLTYKPNKDLLFGSHNFYPQRFTGLSKAYFLKTSDQFHKLGIKTASFVTSQKASKGPWNVMEGLPTLEEHRDLSIVTQAKHLYMINSIDDIIIGNAFASEEELEQLSNLKPYKPSFEIELEKNITDIETKIIFDEPHFYRGDVSEYVIRSTQSRVKYKGKKFSAGNTKNIKKGDVIIINENYGHYAGELQIALQDMKNKGNKNIVGKVKKEEEFLLDLLKPWQRFSFEKKK